MKQSKIMVGLMGWCALVVLSLPLGADVFEPRDIPILMYHKLDEITPTIYWVSDSDFRDQLFLLHDLGYETVDYEDLYAHYMGMAELPAKPVIVSFDDGYEDIYTHALPVMQEFSDPCFFGAAHITTDWIGDDEPNRRYNEWDTDANGPEPITWHMIWPEVAALYDAGWAIEAHSRTHDSTSAPDYNAVYEASSSRVIGEKLGIPDPNFYCYPFGQYTTELITALQDPVNNYLGAMNASGGIENTDTVDLWHIKRIGIMRDDDLDDFASKIGEVVPDLPTLTVNTTSGGSVQINPDQPYYRDDPNVILTVTVDPYYIFTGWSGDLEGDDNPAIITMDEDKTVTANFVFEGTVLFQDGFEGAIWDANWSGSWYRDDYPVHSGSYSASANRDNDGAFTSRDLYTNDVEAICVDFWFQKDDTEADDLLLYYYNGTDYEFIADLDTLGGDDVWLNYTDIITDSQYFNPNFSIQFDAIALTTGENVWVDDVIIAAVGGGTPVPDTTPPTPDPMEWEMKPFATGPTSISMTAVTAIDDTSAVEYYFECTEGGGNDSGWQDSTTYEDTGLEPATGYTYRVKARDKSSNKNETDYSVAASATTADEPKWTLLTYDDFESGWGNYTDGGSDCRMYHGGTWARQGRCAVNIEDNAGIESSFYYTNGVDVDTAGYTRIKVEFWFYCRSMDPGEDFWVQYYDGSTWHTVASYISGTDFENYIFYSKTVHIDEENYTFPKNMKIRFTCDADNDGDDVYIDEIKVSGK
ncbi:MAG: polysaccharide deacetylase family protein [Planctomycetota bacterium]|nr:MAG: polysaccharide deacetylase family protein [Planctomycetota bacterium]